VYSDQGRENGEPHTSEPLLEVEEKKRRGHP